MRAGVAAALPSSEILVMMDGDGSDEVAEMPHLFGPIAGGEADFVSARVFVGCGKLDRCWGARFFAAYLISTLVRLRYGFRYTDMGRFGRFGVPN